MYQCGCKSEQISYADFLILMKGQSRRPSSRASIVWSPQSAALLASEFKEEDNAAADKEVAAPPEGGKSKRPAEKDVAEDNRMYLRKRSKSFDDFSMASSSQSSLASLVQERRTSYPPRVRPSMDADGELVRFIASGARGPLLATREQYKKHRDLRIALCEASKVLDMKTEARRASVGDNDELRSPHQGANLIMKRGSFAPPDLESAHKRAIFEAAVRRGGRYGVKQAKAGHRRKRTQSDVTGMLLAPAAE